MKPSRRRTNTLGDGGRECDDVVLGNLLDLFDTFGGESGPGPNLARQMEAEGRSLEVIDLRSIVPLDEEMIYASVRKTNRVVVAHEDMLTMGFGAEVSARITQNCFAFLDAPVMRVAAQDSFVPAAPNLELAVLPSVQDLRAGVEQVLRF